VRRGCPCKSLCMNPPVEYISVEQRVHHQITGEPMKFRTTCNPHKSAPSRFAPYNRGGVVRAHVLSGWGATDGGPTRGASRAIRSAGADESGNTGRVRPVSAPANQLAARKPWCQTGQNALLQPDAIPVRPPRIPFPLNSHFGAPPSLVVETNRPAHRHVPSQRRRRATSLRSASAPISCPMTKANSSGRRSQRSSRESLTKMNPPGSAKAFGELSLTTSHRKVRRLSRTHLLNLWHRSSSKFTSPGSSTCSAMARSSLARALPRAASASNDSSSVPAKPSQIHLDFRIAGTVCGQAGVPSKQSRK